MSKASPRGFSLFDGLFKYLDRQKPSDRFILCLLLLTLVVALWYTLYALNHKYIVDVPTAGGTLVEGMVGAPRFVNPVLSITRVDHDLSALVYSGLVELQPDGTFSPDLAESVTVSEDGLVYNVILRQDRSFHDGTPVQAEDVAYTIGLIQNPAMKSPLRGNWSGVVVEVISPTEINFVLDNAYTPFMENLAVGILPKHIWESLSEDAFPFSQLNTDPVGSGPYELASVIRDQSGLISQYTLRAFEDGEVPANIDNIIVRFYSNEDEVAEALVSGEINSTASLSEGTLSRFDLEGWQTVEKPLPRVFSIFFNQNKSSALRDSSVREALGIMIDRDALIERSLNGFGVPAYSPLPASFSEVAVDEVGSKSLEDRLAEAKAVLESGNWEESENGSWSKDIDNSSTTLSVRLRSANASVFDNTAAYILENWRALGVEVEVELYEQSDLVQTIIRPRDYEALLFGTDIGRPLDLYPFWHASQREDPGLNVALYTSITSDRLLEKVRVSKSLEERDELLTEFVDEIQEEEPAIFLFSPSFVYVLSPTVHVSDMDRLAKPSERFANVEDWFINESSVWPIFR